MDGASLYLECYAHSNVEHRCQLQSWLLRQGGEADQRQLCHEACHPTLAEWQIHDKNLYVCDWQGRLIDEVDDGGMMFLEMEPGWFTGMSNSMRL
jgi:hypothetical protein